MQKRARIFMDPPQHRFTLNTSLICIRTIKYFILTERIKFAFKFTNTKYACTMNCPKNGISRVLETENEQPQPILLRLSERSAL